MRTGVDCIKSNEDLSNFWHLYQETMEEILNEFSQECEINLFPAMPVSACFEVGRRYMKKTYPKVKVYEEYNGYFESIQLGG